MPGVNILSVPKENAHHFSSRFRQVQERMLHGSSYSHEPIVMQNGTMIGFTAYGSYPRKMLETESFLIVIEGIIYNYEERSIENRLLHLASNKGISELVTQDLGEFVAEADGEFVIVMYDKSNGQLCVFNDAMGRLPLYYCVTDTCFLVSREIKFIVPFLERVTFDRTALMEYLLYGFPLGERTFIKDLYRAMPATLMKFNPNTKYFSKTTVIPVNFENKVMVSKRPKDQIMDLKSLFLTGVDVRLRKSGNRNPVIFLSGGLDSRATLAGLVSMGAKPNGITRGYKKEGEEKYALRIAKLFGIDLATLIIPNPMDKDDFTRLVSLKDGLNPTSVTSMLQTCDEVVARFGQNVIAFSGLYGGEIFRYLNVTAGIASVKKLAKFLLHTPDAYGYSPRKVCKMLSLDEDYMLRYMINHLSSYDETDVYTKYVHFQNEKHYKWAGEGEDRLRFFFWATTPFMSTPFYRYAMSLQESKKGTMFFRDFLHALDPRTCIVEYYNDKSSLNNIWRLRLLKVAETMVRHSTTRRAARSMIDFVVRLKSPKKDSPEAAAERALLKSLILDTLNSSSGIREYFSLAESRAVIEQETNITMLHRILTLLLYMDHVENSGNQYLDIYLD